VQRIVRAYEQREATAETVASRSATTDEN
jgi:hypothetical protein